MLRLPYLLRTAARDGELGSPLQRLLACGHVDDREPVDDLLGLRYGRSVTVPSVATTLVACTNGRRGTRRLLVSG
jgi:hypothetical protein